MPEETSSTPYVTSKQQYANETIAADGTLPPLPSVLLGSFTAIITLLYLDLSMPALQPASALPIAVQITVLIGGLALLLVHIAWLSISQEQLLKHTKLALNEYEKASRRQKLLLLIYSCNWLSLFAACNFQYNIIHTNFHLCVAALTTIFVFYYFSTSLTYWQTNRKTHLAPKAVSRAPENAAALLFLGLAAVPYIWYWKRAIVVEEQSLTPQAKLDIERQQQNPTRVVVPYQAFVGLERWLEQRSKLSNSEDNQENLALAFLANLLIFAPLFFFRNEIWSAIKKLFETQEAAAQAAANVPLGVWHFYNQLLLASAATLPIGAIATICYLILKQPTHIEFTPIGICTFRWLGDRRWESQKITWSELTAIKMTERAGKTRARFSEIAFLSNSRPLVKLNLEAISPFDDREKILKSIERWAANTSREATVIEALQPPVDHSYTELWLQALLAPPQRDRLNPLTSSATLQGRRYSITEGLGTGGQGAAYKAIDCHCNQVVVLKEFLLPIYVDISVRKTALDSFEREARILKSLDHNQIVKLIDFFVEDHRAYLVLEHIEGSTLAKHVAENGPFSEQLVRELAKQMCTILSYLHKMEPPVVHRDFTPENLILGSDGLLKLIDFNVARQLESSTTGSVVGKPAYLPPEQFRGQSVCQSDIYSMGATLSFILTGKQPEPISVSHPKRESNSISEMLDHIVAKATAINVKDRYYRCEEILLELLKQ